MQAGARRGLKESHWSWVPRGDGTVLGDGAEKACNRTGNSKLEKQQVLQSLLCIHGVKGCSG